MYYKRVIIETKKIKTILLFSLIILQCSLVFSPADVFAAESKTDNEISFVWAFAAIKNASGRPESVNIDRDITLKKGDQIKMLVQLTSHCFVYVIHLGSKGEMSLLYPEGAGQHQLKNKVFIPQGDYWFTLDENKGKETVYLLASKTRLISLEALFERYKTLDQGSKNNMKDQILSQIRRIKKQHKKPLYGKAERPVLIGGAFRGLEKEASENSITRHSIQITAKEFYSRTFIIHHE
ncbi:MAG: DUF4384 domain-containing protein [Candidatus Electrothrix sp. GW3-4]|uniref:DUF4384 domain-containing protein n=1 Tax=Candidatus Electrothrix sp. GW3-4 TaxID=3126740 RepID=UPI0030D5CEBB